MSVAKGSGKFTDGPWHVSEDYWDDVCIDSGELVASSYRMNDDDSHEIQFANAKLIAAAPELYEACWKVLQAYRTDWNAMTAEEKKIANDFANDDQLVAETIRAALSKAEGKGDEHGKI